jgi:sugar phosphate isomerase/epimerase
MRLGLGSYTYVWAIGWPGYSQPLHPLTPLGLLDKAAKLGVKVVQFADNLPLERLTSSALQAVIQFAAEHKIELELGAQGIAPDYIRGQLDIARRLPASLMRIVFDTATSHPEPDEVVRTLGPLMREFERAGVRLAAENHDRFKARTLLSIIDRLNSPNAGICLDTANSLGCSEGVEAILDTLGPRVFNLHVKDYVVQRLPHLKGFEIHGRPAGQGHLDIPNILKRLGEMGRDPNVIIELWQAPDPDPADCIATEEAWIADSVRYMRKLIPG